MSPASAESLKRYAMLIESTLRRWPLIFEPSAETDYAIQVERGVVFPAALMGAAPSYIEAVGLESRVIVDERGHRRPVYRGLLVYAALQAVRLAKVEGNDLRPWAEWMAGEVARIEWPVNASAAFPASRGATLSANAWSALALLVGGELYDEAVWKRCAAAVFAQLVHRQLPAGAFLAAGAGDNPETHWYHELVILHAVASYAIQSGDERAAETAARNSEFHQAQTQPDHATNQPWGLPAFIENSSTHPLADQLLHSASALPGAAGGAVAASGVTSILLADALYCLRLLLKAS